MSSISNSSGNHAKLYSGLLKSYRAIVVALLTVGIIGLFQTRELVVRLDERLRGVEGSLVNIEARQYQLLSHQSTRGLGGL